MTQSVPVRPRDFDVCIVTHDDRTDIGPCFDAIAGLERAPREVIVADCASADGTAAAARAWRGPVPVRVIALAAGRPWCLRT